MAEEINLNQLMFKQRSKGNGARSANLDTNPVGRLSFVVSNKDLSCSLYMCTLVRVYDENFSGFLFVTTDNFRNIACEYKGRRSS